MRIQTLLLIGYIALEILGFSYFVGAFGFMALILEILVSGGIGIVFLVMITQRVGINMEKFFLSLRGDIFSLFSSMMLGFLGAFLLILPGIFGDICGLFCVILGFILKPKYKESDFTRSYKQYDNDENNEEIIDVEIIQGDQKDK